MQKQYLHESGFTLLEMLSVVVIIAVVIAIILPVAKTSFEKMRIHQAQADIAALESALEGYKSAAGTYPIADPAYRVPVKDLKLYMKFPPKRVIVQGSNEIFYDPWNIPYRYAFPGFNNTDFADIASGGPDRAINDNWQASLVGNEDNIDNWSQKR